MDRSSRLTIESTLPPASSFLLGARLLHDQFQRLAVLGDDLAAEGLSLVVLEKPSGHRTLPVSLPDQVPIQLRGAIPAQPQVVQGAIISTADALPEPIVKLRRGRTV
jgi:hypothetical protein